MKIVNAIRKLAGIKSSSSAELRALSQKLAVISRQLGEQQVLIDEVQARVTSLLDSDIRARRPIYAEAAAAMSDSIAAMASLPDDRAIRVVFITDSGYALPTAVAVSSMLRHRAPETKYSVTVVSQGLRTEDRELFAPFGPAVSLLESGNEYAGLFERHNHVSPAALLKFNLPSLFPDDDRVLYLDGDVLVFKDLSPLWQAPLDGLFAVAVKDFAACVHGKHNALLGHADYFNTGVMLLNLALMRGAAIRDRLLDAKRRDPIPRFFMDQTAFNIAFDEKVGYVSPEFNMMSANNRRWSQKASQVATFYGMTEKEYDRAASFPAILHLTNAIKPWVSRNAPGYEPWQDEFGVYGAFGGK